MEPTEQRLRRASIALFARRGFHGTGIRDLADAAGLSTASLYHYMGTKEDLLVTIMRDALHRMITAAERTVRDAASPLAALCGLVQMHVLTHAQRPLETRVVDDEMRALTAGRRAEIVALRDRYERVWQDVLDTGHAVGVLHARAPRVARLALVEMCGGIARWYDPAGPLSLDDLADHYTDMALGALGADAPAAVRPSAAAVRALVDEVWADGLSAAATAATPGSRQPRPGR